MAAAVAPIARGAVTLSLYFEFVACKCLLKIFRANADCSFHYSADGAVQPALPSRHTPMEDTPIPEDESPDYTDAVKETQDINLRDEYSTTRGPRASLAQHIERFQYGITCTQRYLTRKVKTSGITADENASSFSTYLQYRVFSVARNISGRATFEDLTRVTKVSPRPCGRLWLCFHAEGLSLP